jgi:hypothetical protein
MMGGLRRNAHARVQARAKKYVFNFAKICTFLFYNTLLTSCNHYPQADGAKRRARVLIPPGYLHPGKRKH